MNKPVKALALLASPRKGGNTEVLLSRVIDGITDEGGEVETISLSEYPVKPIEDCSICKQSGTCTIEGTDNYKMIIDKFLEAECVIFASPVYWFSVSAQMKSFIDRWSCSLRMMPDFQSKVRGKKVAVITVHGEENPTVTQHLFGHMNLSFQYLGMDFIGKVQGKAYEKGEIIQNHEALENAYKLGISIGKRQF